MIVTKHIRRGACHQACILTENIFEPAYFSLHQFKATRMERCHLRYAGNGKITFSFGCLSRWRESKL